MSVIVDMLWLVYIFFSVCMIVGVYVSASSAYDEVCKENFISSTHNWRVDIRIFLLALISGALMPVVALSVLGVNWADDIIQFFVSKIFPEFDE